MTLRVLHIIERLTGIGGTPRKLLYLAETLDRERFASCVVTFGGQGDLDAAIEYTGWEVLSSERRRFSPGFAIDLFQLVRSRAIDVICTHFSRALAYGNIIGLATGVPLAHFEHSNPNIGARAYPKRALADLAVNGCRVIVANSRYTERKTREYYRTPPPILTVPNPVRLGSTQTSNPDLESLDQRLNGAVICLTVGGLLNLRDHGTTIRAVAEINQRIGKARVVLVLVGNGPDRGSLKSLARVLGIEDSVVFLGYQNDASRYLELADCYVSSTLDEGFGIAAAEAMLAGIPVVLADAGANPELIDPDSGVLFRPGDPAALAEAIGELIGDRERARAIGAAARRRAAKLFAPRLYAQRIGRILEMVAAGASRDELEAYGAELSN